MNHRLYITELVGPGLARGLRILVAGRVIRHAHVLVTDLFERLHIAVHTHHALVRPDLLEFIALANDIAEVAEEDLVARAEVADDVGHLVERIFDALGHTAQTQIDAVVGAGADLDKLFETLEAAHHPVDALEAGLKIHPNMPGALKNLEFARKKQKESMT